MMIPMSDNDKNNTVIFRCRRCRATLIGEEFDKHICTRMLTDVQEIEFDYYYIIKDDFNREVITIKSIDGTLYGFVKRERKDSDKVSHNLPRPLSPTESQHQQLTDQQREETADKDNNTIITKTMGLQLVVFCLPGAFSSLYFLFLCQYSIIAALVIVQYVTKLTECYYNTNNGNNDHGC